MSKARAIADGTRYVDTSGGDRISADANAEALTVKARSGDDIGEINYVANDGTTRQGRLDGRPSGLGLWSLDNTDINIYTGTATRAHFFNGENNGKGAFVNNAETYGIWTETIWTPDANQQTVQFISDRLGTWIVVAKIKTVADFQSDMTSTASLDTSTSQTTSTQWSSAFGNYYPSAVRVVGSSNWNKWRDHRSVDWIYNCHNNRPYKHFFTGGNASGMATGGDDWGNGTRFGFSVTGAYDGFGEWHNPYFSFMRMSDTDVSISETFFTTSGSTMNWNAGNDAKLSVHATATSGGQDADCHQTIGYDDTDYAYFRDYPSVSNNHGTDYGRSGGETPTWICIKVADAYTEA